MIQLEQVEIHEVRGIRKLTLELDRGNFAIYGPNGSGKSGVVDAIEFGLTGDITRLHGAGTAGLSVRTHGPHVDARERPDEAYVRLKVHIPALNKSATVTRRMNAPREMEVEPNELEIRSALAAAANHPEITLSRRQIIKFILTEAGTRAKDVQTLLRLEVVDQTRGALKTAANKTKAVATSTEARYAEAKESLRRHLELEKLSPEAILNAVNKWRATLGLQPLQSLKGSELIDAPSKEGDREAAVTRESALRDVEAMRAWLEEPARDAVSAQKELLACIERMRAEPGLLKAMKQRSLVEAGLELAEEDCCPLCDTPWAIEELRAHLREKLATAAAAKALEDTIADAADTLRSALAAARQSISVVSQVAATLSLGKERKAFDSWSLELASLGESLDDPSRLGGVEDHLRTGWHIPPPLAKKAVEAISAAALAMPGADETEHARRSLVIAQERLDVARAAQSDAVKQSRAALVVRKCYNAYCDAAEQVLAKLYEEVEQEFAALYRAVNREDEDTFLAKLSASEGKLDLAVDFYKRGLFPPGAYHSEGHQDGMGLCLYLALMRQLFGAEFRLAVLDDVVMSVDRQHRREICSLLKETFPETQFVITTHDRAWFHQMRNAGLIARRAAVTFRKWTVDGGPIVSQAQDSWDEIEAELSRDDIPAAAASLRRHLEYVAHELAEGLRVQVRYRPDGDYDLGELFPAAVSQFKTLLGKAANVAQRWKDADGQKTALERKARLGELYSRSNSEQWAINKAVHYNAWADFDRSEFEPVVAAFQQLLKCMQCEHCGSWLYASPQRGSEESLRCDCSRVCFNLKSR